MGRGTLNKKLDLKNCALKVKWGPSMTGEEGVFEEMLSAGGTVRKRMGCAQD